VKLLDVFMHSAAADVRTAAGVIKIENLHTIKDALVGVFYCVHVWVIVPAPLQAEPLVRSVRS
jgi:hypothetical protein